MMDADATIALIDRAEALIDAGRAAEAQALLAQAIAAEPGNARAYCLQALALLTREQHPMALRSAETAVRLDPSGEWGHRLRAIVLLAMGKKRQAVEAAREAVRIAPFESAALHTLARCQLGAGRKREARATAEELRRVAPEWSSVYELLGLISLEERNFRAAEAHYRDALRLDPGSWAAMNNLGLALQRQGRRKEAIDCFHQAARLNPSKELVRKNLSGAVRNYTGVGTISFIYLLVHLVRSLAQGSRPGEAGEPLPPWAFALIIGGVGLVLGAAYLLRKRRLAELHPEVGHFYQDEAARERRRRFREIPLIVVAVFCGLLAFGYTVAWIAGGPAYAFGRAMDGVTPYVVLCVAAFSAASGLAWLSWRRKHPR